MLRLLARLRQAQGERGDRAAVHPTCMQQRIVFSRAFRASSRFTGPVAPLFQHGMLLLVFSTVRFLYTVVLTKTSAVSSIGLVDGTQLSKLRDTSGALVLYPHLL